MANSWCIRIKHTLCRRRRNSKKKFPRKSHFFAITQKMLQLTFPLRALCFSFFKTFFPTSILHWKRTVFIFFQFCISHSRFVALKMVFIWYSYNFMTFALVDCIGILLFRINCGKLQSVSWYSMERKGKEMVT